MGNNLFGANISAKIAAALGPKLAQMVLVKRSAGTRTAGAVTAGTNPSEARHACRGILSSRIVLVGGTLLPERRSEILILGDTLPAGVVPTENDRVEAEGSTWNIGAVARDPDAASYTCAVHR